jgi:CxxC motif-containing protein (DUF1111 family)
MGTTSFSRACSLASLAAVLMGSTVWSGTASAQNATTTTTAATTTTATTATDTANAQFRRPPTGGGSSSSSRPTDPGVRGGAPGAGDALTGLSDAERSFFDVSKEVFQEVDAGPDGLGPRFNLDSCSGCHSHPTIGGTSPATNPQVTVATLMGAKNTLPSFITADGPVREARFVRNPDGSPDGGVHALFVITGRTDAPGCNITQPNFAAQVARNNVVFRIPTPLFGLGLVEAVTDGALVANLAANAQQKRALGISGRFNRNGNDGTIARFGWKAQNKSLLLFSGEAYNVEMGITNELFQSEREDDPNCQFKSTPNDGTPLEAEDGPSPSAGFQSDIDLFAAFMRLSAPPTPASDASTPVAQTTGTTAVASAAATDVASVMPAAAGATANAASSSTSSTSGTTVARGSQVFANVGCQACHTKSLTTGQSRLTGQSNVTIQPYSDFALHDMGAGLADGVSQGTANGNEFRTAPLWGVGQRIFFLHDGRSKDLHETIQAHASRGSEANTVINNYNLLSRDDKQALVNFLRSL